MWILQRVFLEGKALLFWAIHGHDKEFILSPLGKHKLSGLVWPRFICKVFLAEKSGIFFSS